MKCVFSWLVAILLLGNSYVFCISDVPAVLWNIKGISLSVKPVSAFEISSKNYMDDFLKESLGKKSTSLLVFLNDQLSLEELSPEFSSLPDGALQGLEDFLDVQPYMLLPHVLDPQKPLHDVNCKVEEIHLKGKLDEDTLQAVSAALDRSCVVILHLPPSRSSDEDTKVQNSVTKDLFHPQLHTAKNNVIGMYSAIRSSWDSSEMQRKSRSLLAETTIAPPPPVKGTFFNSTNGCIIMYATKITIDTKEALNDSAVIVPLDAYDTSQSECPSNSSFRKFVITFSNVPRFTTFTLSMAFEQKLNYSYRFTSGNVTIGDRTEDVFPSDKIEVPLGFSYSCGKGTWETRNASVDYIITMEGFQIQPFETKEIFSNSFDCTPFFTLPIWMGLIVGILFILVLNSGIYALFAVKTMDRFDDPKGKTISVALSAD